MAYTKTYSVLGLQAVQLKDQRISWLSIFSSLSQLNEKYLDELIKQYEAKDITDLAFKINIHLYVEYNFPDKEQNKEMEIKLEKAKNGVKPEEDIPF